MYGVDDLVGKAFEDGGRGPERFDCWGLCREVYRRNGITLEDYTICCSDCADIHALYDAENKRWTAQIWPDVEPLSVLAIKMSPYHINHVGVYLGGDQFIHTREKTGVVIERIAPWLRRIAGFYKRTKERHDDGFNVL